MQRMLTLADNGTKLLVAPGDEIVCELPEKATAGYEWTPHSVPDGVDVRLERPGLESASPPGADAITRVRVLVRGPVRGMLVLEHRQPWESSREGATGFEIDIRTSNEG